MKKSSRLFLSFVILLTMPVWLTACGGEKDNLVKNVKVNEEPYSEQQYLMGTYVRIQIFDDGKEDILKKGFDRVKELADQITVNDGEANSSEIDKVNQQAGVEPVKVSEDIYELVKEAYAYSENSDGGFDLAIGPITQLWHIGFDDARKPSQEEIDEALKLVNYHDVELNDDNQTVFLKEKGMALDLGAIAKGFITDEVVEVLKENDVTTAIVDLGGNVYVLGTSAKKEGQPWTVGIQDPEQSRNTIVGSVPATNQSLVTSGIYERNLEVDGEFYHHLFNPKTGYPFDNELAGVSIISEQSIDGDGLSTAVFSMGVEEGMKYVEALDNVDVLFITKTDELYLSSGIKETFKINEESHYVIKELSE